MVFRIMEQLKKFNVSYDANDVQFNVEYNNAITFKDVTVTE